MRTMLVVAALTLAFSLSGADPDPDVMSIKRDSDLLWIESPNTPGLWTATLSGNPSAAGPYIIRVRFAPGVFSRPHFHPEERTIVVLKGTWWVGAGPRWDKDATTPLAPGSFVVHHPNRIHFDGAMDEEVVVQISGVGPSATTPVDKDGKPK
jgi:quercetin dioxygenase-like cupin family protein